MKKIGQFLQEMKSGMLRHRREMQRKKLDRELRVLNAEIARAEKEISTLLQDQCTVPQTRGGEFLRWCDQNYTRARRCLEAQGFLCAADREREILQGRIAQFQQG